MATANSEEQDKPAFVIILRAAPRRQGEQIGAVMHDLHEGVCNRFTLVSPDADDRFLAIAHGLHWSEATASNLLLVCKDREILEGDGKPETSAVCIHGRIHRVRRNARCVLHTHMPYATALSMIEGGRLEPAHQTALRFHGRITYDDSFNGLAFDAEEGDRIADVLGDGTLLFLANHGVIVVGPPVAQAYDDLYSWNTFLPARQHSGIAQSGFSEESIKLVAGARNHLY